MLLSMNSLSHILPQRNAQQRLISSLVGSGKALAVAHRSNGGIGGHEAFFAPGDTTNGWYWLKESHKYNGWWLTYPSPLNMAEFYGLWWI